MLQCKITNKRYIGQAVCYIKSGHNTFRTHGSEGRWIKHIQEARSHNNRCSALNSAIRKYSHHNFILRTLLICDERQLDYFETKFIRQYNTLCPSGYNLRAGGSRGRHSQTTKDKLVVAKSGENNHMYGKHHTVEAKAKISAGNSGKIRTDEYRLNMSRVKGRNESNKNLPMYVYYVKRGKFEGYVVKHHPRMSLTKKSFTSTKYTMDEKLQQASDYVNAL